VEVEGTRLCSVCDFARFCKSVGVTFVIIRVN
jgi:hypothetical protein